MASIRFVLAIAACALLAFVCASSRAHETPACADVKFSATKEPAEIAREIWNCLDCCIRAGYVKGNPLVDVNKGKFCHCDDEL